MFFWVQSKIAMEHAPLFVAPFVHCYSGNRSFPEGLEMDQTHIIIWASDFPFAGDNGVNPHLGLMTFGTVAFIPIDPLLNRIATITTTWSPQKASVLEGKL